MKNSVSTTIALLAMFSTVSHAQKNTANGNWSCFRGPDRTGVAPAGNDSIPLTWSDTQNIVWKTPLPGPGGSCPIAWGDRIYLTSYSGFGLTKDDSFSNINKLVRHLVCVDRRTGDIRWKADVPTEQVREHGLSEFGFLHGYASSTPVADESGVYVYYGRAGVFAYNHDGKPRWKEPLGSKEHNWGSAASPILFENLLIVHANPESRAIIAFDKMKGGQVWSVPTGEGGSWSTPLIVKAGGRDELVYHHDAGHSSPGRVGAINPRDGRSLWECSALSDYLCPSPVARDGVTYWLTNNKATAVRVGGKGDVTESHIVWTTPRGSCVCTPIIHGGHLYWLNEENGIAHCVDLKNGAPVYKERLEPSPGRVYASGVLVGDRMYWVSREKGTYVIAAKPQFAQLAHNTIESDTSVFNATPAVSRGQLFLRSNRFLYCIGAK